MAAPGTIIGQIQPTQAQGTLQQVGGNAAQLQQMQQGAQQGVSISTSQQVHLSANVKDDSTTGANDAMVQNMGEAVKENGIDGKSLFFNIYSYVLWVLLSCSCCNTQIMFLNLINEISPLS